MTTTTGNFAAFGSGWANRENEDENENLANSDKPEKEKEKEKEKDNKRDVIKGGKSLLVGEKFLKNLEKFLDKNLEEQIAPSGPSKASPEISAAIQAAAQADDKVKTAQLAANDAKQKAIDAAIRSSLEQAKKNQEIINSLRGLDAKPEEVGKNTAENSKLETAKEVKQTGSNIGQAIQNSAEMGGGSTTGSGSTMGGMTK